MNIFTERHHAFISATFYRIMKDECFEGYRETFRIAVRLYAQQRGSRMAQRAIRDGRPLNFASYRYYAEWQYSPQTLAEMPNASERFVEGSDVKIVIHGCPWSSQYLEMNLLDGILDYCAELDESLARGFNPKIEYEVCQTMHNGKDCCIHYQRNADNCGEEAYGAKNPENVKCFLFHCAHVYKTFSETMTAIYKSKGLSLCAKVLDAFSEKYGKELADKLLEYRPHDFNFI